MAGERGVRRTGASLHYGQLRIADNLALICAQGGLVLTGATVPAASVSVEGNVLHVIGTGIVAGTDQLRIADNEVVGLAADRVFHGIELDAGFAKGALDRLIVSGNRLMARRPRHRRSAPSRPGRSSTTR